MPRRNSRASRTIRQGLLWAQTTLSSSLTTSLNDDDQQDEDDLVPNSLHDGDESSIIVFAESPEEGNDEEALRLDTQSEDEEEVPLADSTTLAEQVDNMMMNFCRTTTTRNNTELLCSSNESNEINDNNDNDNNSKEEQVQDECNVELTPADCASLKFLFHCHNGGVSLEFYDILFAIIRKVSAENVVDITKLPKRDTFLKSLRARISSPKPILSEVAHLQVPHFDILLQIRDLLGSFIFNDLSNLCVNIELENRYTKFIPTEDDQFVEMCAQDWYKETYKEYITAPTKQFLLPLIFYIDETGTDVYQRYPLEPLMFTFGILRNAVREKSSSWRHAGFVPKVGKSDTKSLDPLQLYHDCMAMVLSTLKPIQDKPPLEWLRFGDEPPVQKELIIQVCFVMGDQKSQDNLVGRKLNNSGWAGRTHRGCMCSGPSSSDPCLRCQPISIEVVHRLRDISITSYPNSQTMLDICAAKNNNTLSKKDAKAVFDFVKRRASLALGILGEVFTMHPLRNAWDHIGFGSNKNGILRATLDDPMHFNESGLFDGITKAFYGCFTEAESKIFENTTRSLFRNMRSSVRSDYPKTRISRGFSNCTLKTANETVGSLFSVVLTVHDNNIFDLMEATNDRQQDRYLTFPVTIPKNTKARTLVARDNHLLERFPSRRNYTYGRDRSNDLNKAVFPRTNKSCRLLFHHLKKHGLGFLLDLELDEIQMEYFLVESWKVLGRVEDTKQFYPEVDCLRKILPLYPFPYTTRQDRQLIERYYEGHLHQGSTLRSTKRGDVVKLSQEDITSHTIMEESDVDSDDHVELAARGTGRASSRKRKPGASNKTKTKKKKRVIVETNETSGLATTISFQNLRSRKQVEKHGRIKPYTAGTGSTSAVLCGVSTYIEFIELALCLHAYLHYSKDLAFEQRCQPEVFDRGIREFLRRLNSDVYRGDDSVDTDTCKIHCHLHVLLNILLYGDPMQYDAAKGERGLKDWAKNISQTAQKSGIETFLFQTIQRVATLQLMRRAEQLDLWKKRKEEVRRNNSNSAAVPKPARSVMNRKAPSFRYVVATKKLTAIDRHFRSSVPTVKTTGLIDKRILAMIERDHDDLECIEIWGEIYLSNETGGQLLRGTPRLDHFGPMFDWAAVIFETEKEDTTDVDSDSTSDNSDKGVIGPAKILAFYKDSAGMECAVVHAAYTSKGKETKAGNTLLIQNVLLEFDKKGEPGLRTIRVDQIDRGILAFEHENYNGPLPPRVAKSDRGKYIVSCVNDRANWAYQFYNWANKLPAGKIQPTIPEANRLYSDTESELGNDDEESEEEEESGSSNEEESIRSLVPQFDITGEICTN
jgi:hypothetical protein